MISLLESAHLGAAWRGRLLAGVRGRISADERAYAQEVAGEQAEFLIEWVDQIRDGRYSRDDVLGLAGMRQRGRYYLERLRGTANEMFIVASEPDEDWWWDLGPAEHCDDCLYFAANSPWKEVSPRDQARWSARPSAGRNASAD